MAATLQLPDFANFLAAPRTIAHEGHQGPATTFALASRRVTFVRIRTGTFLDKAGTVTPGAIIPVILDASLASRTTGRHSGFRPSGRVIESAPGTALHTLRYRPLATPARMSNIECMTVVSLELAPLQLPPGGTPAACALGFRALLLSHMGLRLAKRRLHLHGVTKALFRIYLNRLPEHFYEFGAYARLQFLLPL